MITPATTHSNADSAAWNLRIPARFRRNTLVFAGVSLFIAVSLAAGWFDFARFWHAYLLAFSFWLSLALGALFFVLLQHLTRARWSVVIRRQAELLAASVPYLAVAWVPLAAVVLFGKGALYHWADPDLIATDAVVAAKSGWLNPLFFVIRGFGYLAVWSFVARYYLRQSVLQDDAHEQWRSDAMQRWSGPAMMLYGVTVCFAAFDWLMSLDPHWYSTIYGVYFFSGAAVAGFATLILTSLAARRAGIAQEAISTEHLHDLAKFLFGFVFFWGYIAFSQYLLIWYANIPEETTWYIRRQENGWQYVSLALLFGNLLFPFAGLLSRQSKRSHAQLAFWASWLLLMHALDLFWLIYPEFLQSATWPGLLEICVFLGLGSWLVAGVASVARDRSIVPRSDPHLAESLAFHNST